MKIFKKLITLCLVAALLCTTAFAYGEGTLKYLGAVPEGVTDSTVVTREILSYSLAKLLMPNGTFDKVDTAFEDVKADNAYSGYIKYISDRGIMNGSGDGKFNPKSNISVNELATVLVKALGYGVVAEAKDGWPGGYTSVAASLKLFNGADITGSTINCASLKKMLLNFMEVPAPEEQIYTNNGSYELALSTGKDSLIYAEKNLELYEYEAVVVDIDWETYKATLRFSEQEDALAKYDEGDSGVFDVSTSLNIALYENLPASFVIYDDKLIVDAVLEDGLSIRYGVVDSVNNKTLDTSYNVNHINAITITDDEEDYEFSDDCVFYVNGKEYTSTLSLMNKYIKFASKDDEIILISMYDLTDGGMITSATKDYLNYSLGSTPRRIDKISDVVETIVVIDGEARSYKELKSGMLFSYYRSEKGDVLVIMASEKKFSDVLYGVNTSDKTLSLGNIDVEYSDDIYSSPDNAIFTQGADALLDYCDTDVIVTLDIYNRARYVVSYEAVTGSNEFFGYVLGYKEATGFNGAQIQMVNVNEDGAAAKIYDMADKITYKSGISSLSDITSAIGSTDGSALFEVEFNSKGQVKGFSKLKEYEGFEGKTWSGGWGSFLDDGDPYLVVSGKKLFIPRTTPVICIKDDGGELELYKLSYSQLVAKNCNSKIQLKFYGYESSPELRFVLMVGDMHVISGTKAIGVVDRCGSTINSEGDIVSSVTIDGKTYEIMKSSAAIPKEGNLVSYSVSLFNPDAAVIEAAIDLKDDFENWNGKTYGKSVFTSGVVEKSDKLKVILEGSVDGSLCFYYEPGDCKFYGVDSEGELTNLSYQDIYPGMEIVIGVETGSNGGASVAQVFVRKD